MLMEIRQPLCLSDALDRDLGQVIVERTDGKLVLGQFVPGPDYPAVAQLFADYVEAANELLLSIVGELDLAIRQLGLRLHCGRRKTLLAIDDVQIGSGRINFRFRSSVPPQAFQIASETK
jgi:hypothetical protein